MSAIVKGTPLHRLNVTAGSAGLIAEVFAGDVADACNLCAKQSPFISNLKAKSAVRPGDRLTMPTADIRKLIAAAQGQEIDGDEVSDVGPHHSVTVFPATVSDVHDITQPTTEHKAKAVPEGADHGTLKSQQMPKGNK